MNVENSCNLLQYLTISQQTSHNSTTSFLRPGSKFRGTQQSDRQVYDVQVEVKDVDMAESFLCGYLRIQGKSSNHLTSKLTKLIFVPLFQASQTTTQP